MSILRNSFFFFKQVVTIVLDFSQSFAGACRLPEVKGHMTACGVGGFWPTQVGIDFLHYGRRSEEMSVQVLVKWTDVR